MRSVNLVFCVRSLMLLTMLSACAEKPQVPPFNKAVVQQFADLMQQRDDKKISMMFTEDAKLMPPEKPIIEGRAEIQAYMQDLLLGQSVPTELREVEQISMGDYVYRDGTLIQHSLNGTTQIGKFSQVWKYVDGSWKQHRVMWNISTPTESTPAPASAK